MDIAMFIILGRYCHNKKMLVLRGFAKKNASISQSSNAQLMVCNAVGFDPIYQDFSKGRIAEFQTVQPKHCKDRAHLLRNRWSFSASWSLTSFGASWVQICFLHFSAHVCLCPSPIPQTPLASKKKQRINHSGIYDTDGAWISPVVQIKQDLQNKQQNTSALYSCTHQINLHPNPTGSHHYLVGLRVIQHRSMFWQHHLRVLFLTLTHLQQTRLKHEKTNSQWPPRSCWNKS